MKYFLVLLATLFVLGCVSSQNKNENGSQNSKTAIYDEEFDVLVAPEYNYEKEIPYSEQIKTVTKTTNVSVNNTNKPAKHSVQSK